MNNCYVQNNYEGWMVTGIYFIHCLDSLYLCYNNASSTLKDVDNSWEWEKKFILALAFAFKNNL